MSKFTTGKEHTESMRNDVSTSAKMISSTCEKRPSCNPSDNFRKAMNADQFEDSNLPDDCAEIRRNIAADGFSVVHGDDQSSNLRRALHAIQSLDEYKPEFCAMITDPTDWKHIEPKELKLVLFKCPFGETEPNELKTRAMLDIYRNVRRTTNDSEHPLALVIVTQLDTMIQAINIVGRKPDALFKENNEQTPKIIGHGVKNRTMGPKRKANETMLSLVKDLKHANDEPIDEPNDEPNDEPIDPTMGSVPMVSQNHTTVTNQAQASSHLEFVNTLVVDKSRVTRISILSESCLVVSTCDHWIHSYNRQEGITTDKLDIEFLVEQLTTVDENKAVVLEFSYGNARVLNISNTGALTPLIKINVGMSACGMAHSNGQLLISYGSGHTVNIMNMNGKMESTKRVKEDNGIRGCASSHSKLALSPNHDTIYISDLTTYTVTALKRKGSDLDVKNVKNVNQLQSLSGMTVDSVGRVYVWCALSNIVCFVSPENDTVTTLTVKGRNTEDATFCKWTNSIYVVDSDGVSVYKINAL